MRSKIKKIIKSILYSKYKDYLKINYNSIKNYDVLSLKNKNVFCGYYDLNPIKDGMVLVNVFDENIKDIEFGYFNLNTKNSEFTAIGKTPCCSWQQGCRLRWSNIYADCIYYNTVKNNEYVTILKNIVTNEERVISSPLYDIDKTEKFGASLNYSRLERLRPGYGYSIIPESSMENAPSDDGLFLVDINNNKKELVISLDQLSKNNDSNQQFEHYINHLCFSSDSKKLLFFHLWNEKKNKFNWQNELGIYYLEEKKYKIIETTDIVSHYCWIDDNRILVTIITPFHKEKYRIYDLTDNNKYDLDDDYLRRDGHPTMIGNNIFVSDTYPNSRFIQSLFKYDIDNKDYLKLVDIYSNPNLNREKRCDLHPKYDLKSNSVLIDSTFKRKKRSVVVLKMK